MIVCLCYGVSERKVRSTIEKGARTVDEVSEGCGAGGGCRSCHCQIETLLLERAPCSGSSDVVSREPGLLQPAAKPQP